MDISKLSYSRQKQIIGECLKASLGETQKYKPKEADGFEGWVGSDGVTYLLLKTPLAPKDLKEIIADIATDARGKTHLLCFSAQPLTENQAKLISTSTVSDFLLSFFACPGPEAIKAAKEEAAAEEKAAPATKEEADSATE